MTAEQLSRSTVLAYRAMAHDLERPAQSVAGCGVLEVGVQDTPAGATAGLALQARLPSPGEVTSSVPRGLVLVHSLRGAMHVHRARDLGLLTAALGPDDPADGDHVDAVAAAMAAVMDGAATLTKGELSTRVTPLLPPRLRPWCASCSAEHVPDGLFRMATLPAGLRLRPLDNRSAVFFRAAALPDPQEPEGACRELLRRFLRRCGPATARDVAGWAGLTPPTARGWWSLLARELVPVRVEGKRLAMHTEDLAAAGQASPPTAVRLLPPYDPLAEVAHRELVLPDADRRREVWRAVANPGLVLVAGEITGTWRRRGSVLTVTAFRTPQAAERRAVRERAAALDTALRVEFAA